MTDFCLRFDSSNMRIFIHNVDSYLGQVLVRELRKTEGGLNRIFGTVLTNVDNAPKVVKRVLSREDHKRAAKMIETIQSCSLVIIDLYNCSIDDLHFAISALKVDPKQTPPQAMGELDRSVVFVLISSVMTWSGTDVGEEEILKDRDYQRRMPRHGSRYELWKELEDLVFACFNREESKTKALVVAGGILYGEGEDMLCPLFENAWRGRREHSISAPGSNRIPMVHVCDLARLVREASFPLTDGAEAEVPCPYFLAIDQPPFVPPPPPHLEEEERGDGEAQEGDEKTADQEDTGDGESQPASPTSASRPETAGGPTTDAEEGEAPDDADKESQGEKEEAGNEEGAQDEDAAAAEDLGPKWLPSTQSEVVQGIVDELCEQHEVPIVAIPSPSEPGTPRSDAAEIDAAGPDLHKPLVLSPEERLREAMTLNLRMEPSEVMLTEEFAGQAEPPGWCCKEGLLKNVRKIADEFCKARKLQALRVLIAGPPASGKSTLAKAVSEHFRIPHLEPKVEDLPGLPEELAVKVCRYRGYVLDVGSLGYEETEKLFCIDQPAPPPGEGAEEDEEEGAGEGEDEEGEEPKEKAPKLVRGVNKEICPAFVIVTQAPPPLCRAFWKKRAKKKHDIKDFERDMEIYIATNLDDSKPSLTDFFQDFCRLGVFNLPIAGKDREDILESARIFMEKLGRPFNYLPTEEEVAAEILARRADRDQMSAAEEMVRERSLRETGDADSRAERVRHMERMQLIQDYEEQRKHLDELALREYLMQNIVPTMTEGLIEVCKVLPENPLDYLATFLEQQTEKDKNPKSRSSSNGRSSSTKLTGAK